MKPMSGMYASGSMANVEGGSDPEVCNDIAVRMDQLANDRTQWESAWTDVADYCLPDAARFTPGSSSGSPAYDQLTRSPTSIERGRKRYDDTAVRSIDQLASYMESLVTPQSAKWHGVEITDPLAPEETDEEKEYFETYRDYLFSVRYNTRSGFIGAHQKALRSTIALGTGIVFIEEGMGLNAHITPALYRFMDLSECYLAVDAQGEPDTLYRKFTMTARQMVQRFGEDKVHDTVKRANDKPGNKEKLFTIIHAVQPRADAGSYGSTNRKAPYSSCYIDRDNMKLIGESGFYEFPFAIYYWGPVSPGMPYAQSPVMYALSDIKGLNAIRKTSLKGLQGYMDPPHAIAHDGIMNRPNLNPGKMNYRAIDSNGRLQIQPIQSGARPDFIQEIIGAERDNVKDSLYIRLFQILIQNPNQTATEAMIRANEKGELLGPAGGKIQQAMSREVERLAGILERKGALRPGSPLEPPDSLRGKNFGPRFTSPLDRLRRSAEGLGIQRVLQTALPLMQVDPGVADNFDMDEIVREVGQIEGAPQKIYKTKDERDAARAQRAQQQAVAQSLEMAKTGGEAAKNIVPAMGQMAQLAGLPGMKPATGAPPQ